MPHRPSRSFRHRVGAMLSLVGLATALTVGAPVAATAADTSAPAPSATAQDADSSAVAKPPAPPKLTGIDVGLDRVTIGVDRGDATDDHDGGPVHTFEAIITRSSTGETTTQQRGTAGTFEFTDLAPGSYALSVNAYGDQGSSGVRGWDFFILDVSAAPVIDGYTAEQNGVTLKIRNANEADGWTRQAISLDVTYHLSLDDGVEVHERADSALTGEIGLYNALKPGTTYRATLTARYTDGQGVLVATSEPVTARVTTPDAGGGAESTPPPAQNPPTERDLASAPRGGVSVPAQGTVGGTVTVGVGNDTPAGSTVHGWLFSTPTSLGDAVVDDDKNVVFTIPGGVPAGDHRLAVTNAAGDILGWGEIHLVAGSVADGGSKVDTAPAGSGAEQLAATGSDLPVVPVSAAVLSLVAGTALLVIKRRRQRA